MAVMVVVPSPDTAPGPPRIAAALLSSLRAVRGQVPGAERIKVVEFADLRAFPEPPSGAAEAERIERQLLEGWWGAAVRSGQGRGVPEDLPRALAATEHFAHQHRLRHELRDRTQACIGPETQVVVGHALGGLIAYEALCAVSEQVAVSLVTLGPALCGPPVVFDLLDPPPRSNQGEWPAAVRHWFNIVAHTDLTALCEAKLTARFGPGIDDMVIEPRAVTESLSGYLLDRSTGLAVATGLATEFR